MTAPLIEIRDLSHTYMVGTPNAKEALHRVDVEVYAGEALALVGPTGSGKSTLLQHMNGIYTPQSGTVHVLDRDLAEPDCDFTALRREVGLVLQNPEHQIFERYVGDDVAFGPRMSGLSGVELTRRVRWAMEQVGLDFDLFRDRPTFALSGGERRKVGLAGIVALKPRILLLDEPTAGLDPFAHDELLRHLEDLKASGMTLVMATHNMDDVARLADHVTALAGGEVVVNGPTREFFARGEEIVSIGLGLPKGTAVVHALSRHGFSIRQDVLTLHEAEEALLAELGARR